MKDSNLQYPRTYKDVLDEADEILSEMRNVDMKHGYNTIIAPKKRKQRLHMVVLRVAAVLVPAFVAVAAYIALRPEMPGITVISGLSTTLTLPDGQQILVDTLTGKTNVPGMTGISIDKNSGTFTYINEGMETVGEDMSVAYSNLYVPKGNQFEMVLEDGSVVYLNADSRLSFPAAFPSGERRVRVEGEAYFKVAHEPDRPFIVEANNQTFRVLGTEFNIDAYSGGMAVYATLVSGKIAVSYEDVEVVLNPDERAVWDHQRHGFVVDKVNAVMLTSWKDGLFVFSNSTLEQAMNKIARWYDADIRFVDEDVKTIEFKGNMEKYDNLQTILDIIEKSSSVRFKIKGNKVSVYLDK